MTSEMTKFLIVLCAGFVGLSVLLVTLIGKVRGNFKPYQKSTIVYLLVSALFFALVALATYPAIFENKSSTLIFLQVYFLFLGCFHLFCMHRLLRWSGGEQSFWPELIFTLTLSLFGSIVFLILHHFIAKDGLGYLLLGSILFFIIPFFFSITFQRSILIPPKILKEWFYPLNQQVEEPDENKMKNLLVISFEFQKQTSDVNYTNFRAKAPVDMEMGRLFYYFINDYNDRNPKSKIQYINVEGQANGWIFYKKPKWYSVVTQYIDAEKTIFTNNIRENDVIICTRS